jgi:hypothetical protein
MALPGLSLVTCNCDDIPSLSSTLNHFEAMTDGILAS